MKTMMVYIVGNLVLVAVAAFLAAVVSTFIARKKGLKIPGITTLSVWFVLSALVGWGGSWLCAFLIKGKALTLFALYTSLFLTWYLTGIAVTLIAATSLGKSASSKVLVIALPWLCCFTVLVGSLSVPIVRSARGFDDRLRCMNHLHQVYIGLSLYAEDHSNNLPSRTDEILEPYLAGCKEILSCPIGKGANSYGYDSTSALGASGILMWDRVGNHRGGRNVLFCNGKVEWLSEEHFKSVAGDTRN